MATAKDNDLICNLRARRVEAGFSQIELAERVGVSRQALSAVEAGRQVPSTTLTLRLASALSCSVEQLFRLPGAQVVLARAAKSLVPGERVVVARVDGDWVAHPVVEASRRADGRWLGTRAAPPSDKTSGRSMPGVVHGAVECFGSPSDHDDVLLVAGCAPLLGILAGRMTQRAEPKANWIPANSGRALELLRQGLVHFAGVHLGAGDDVVPHARAGRRALPGQPLALVHLARWNQGLVVAQGNPLALDAGSDLLRPDLRYAMREQGSGAQKLLQKALRRAGGSTRVVGSAAPRAGSHHDVAKLVGWGVADVGVAIEGVAVRQRLGFIPLARERFDLVIPQARLDTPAARRFLEVLNAGSFRADAGALPGYDLSSTGELSALAGAEA